jgi:hypothetical protein
MSEYHQAPVSRGRAALLLAGAAGAAALILIGAVLPAEFNYDPLGIGKATGIAALWAPEEVKIGPDTGGMASARSLAGPIRTIEADIPLGPGGDPAGGDQIEYKAHLAKGATYLYEWSVKGASAPDDVYSEFHGHTLGKGGSMTVAEYRKASGIADRGALTAPFDGIHGWYFLNTSERKVTVRLRITGFFDVIPPGAPGNEGGIIAKLVQNP